MNIEAKIQDDMIEKQAAALIKGGEAPWIAYGKACRIVHEQQRMASVQKGKGNVTAKDIHANDRPSR